MEQDLEKISSLLNIEKELLEKYKGLFTISAIAKLLNVNPDAIYAAARKSKFVVISHERVRSKMIYVGNMDFLNWFQNYSPKKKQHKECALPDCTNFIRRSSAKYCCQEHYVRHRKMLGEFSRMGRSGTYGKGLGERDKSPEAQAKRSRAASLGKLPTLTRTLVKKT